MSDTQAIERTPYTLGTQQRINSLPERLERQLKADVARFFGLFPSLPGESIIREVLKDWSANQFQLYTELMHCYAREMQDFGSYEAIYAPPATSWEGSTMVVRQQLMPLSAMKIGGDGDNLGWFRILEDTGLVGEDLIEEIFDLIEARDIALGLRQPDGPTIQA